MLRQRDEKLCLLQQELEQKRQELGLAAQRSAVFKARLGAAAS